MDESSEAKLEEEEYGTVMSSVCRHYRRSTDFSHTRPGVAYYPENLREGVSCERSTFGQAQQT